MVLRQGHVGNLVVRFCHQHLEGGPHGRRGYAKFPQERSQRIKAACFPEEEHSIGVSAKANQVLRRFTCMLATLNVDDTFCPVVAVSIDIGSTRDPPRSIEETTAVGKQAAGGVYMSLTGATTLNRSIRHGGTHSCEVSPIAVGIASGAAPRPTSRVRHHAG